MHLFSYSIMKGEYSHEDNLPKDIFSKIMKRLGLEKQLILIKKHLRVFLVLSVMFVALSIFAFIGLKTVIEQSSFLEFMSLLFSDPDMVTKYWQSFILLITESFPGLAVAGFIVSIAFFMLFIRLFIFAIERVSSILDLIKKQKYAGK